jgi:hypothetical protein
MTKSLASIVIVLAFMSGVHAGPYVEFGISAVNGCVSDYDEKLKAQGCSSNPFGLVAVGYEWSGLMFEVEHRSSLAEKDPGINAATIKYRMEWK